MARRAVFAQRASQPFRGPHVVPQCNGPEPLVHQVPSRACSMRRPKAPAGGCRVFIAAAAGPEAPPDVVVCPEGTTYGVPVRSFIYTPDESPDRLPEREFLNLDLDRFQLSNGFGPGAPGPIRDGAAASRPRCGAGSIPSSRARGRAAGRPMGGRLSPEFRNSSSLRVEPDVAGQPP